MGGSRWLTSGAALIAVAGLAACSGQEDPGQNSAEGANSDPASTEAEEPDCPFPLEDNERPDGDSSIETAALDAIDAEEEGWSAEAWHYPEEDCVAITIWTDGASPSEVSGREYRDLVVDETGIPNVPVAANDGSPPESLTD